MDRALLAYPALLALCLAGVLNLFELSAADAPTPSTTQDAAADTVVQEKTQAEQLLEHFREEQSITNSLKAVMVWIPAGFRVGKTEVTQAQYEAVMDENPSHFKGSNRPVEMVSPKKAVEFCRRLTAREHLEGILPKEFAYGLPSEQDFEAYLAGTPLETAYVSRIGDRPATAVVESLPPNELGLYDVRGNVWEWCIGAVARGASYQSHEDYLAPGFRFVGSSDTAIMDIGFRVVLRE